MAAFSRRNMILAPKTKKQFNVDWAKKILITSKLKDDPDWLLADCLKVLDVTVIENPDPGMLSHSYFVQVSYKEQTNEVMRIDSWFVKIPKSITTSPMDSVEAFMYNKVLPEMTKHSLKLLKGRSAQNLPIPKVLYCCHEPTDMEGNVNIVVTEDLRNKRFKPLNAKTCGVVYMKAQMKTLAQLHAAAFAYQEEIGGKRAFLRKNPEIRERLLPKMSIIKKYLEQRLLAYLTFLSRIQPDIQHQLKIFIKFEKHLFKVFKSVYKTQGLHDMKIMIHGDSKLDNFLFKKVAFTEEDEYDAVLIDWQGASYDFLSGDVMWALYGFMKNLPDKNSTVDSFLDYSIAYYHQELLKHLKMYNLSASELYLPDNEYDGVNLIKKGFVFDFLRVVLIKPILSIQEPELLLDWFQNQDTAPLPDASKIFRGGQNSVNFIHLYFTIATEVGVFHELAPLCFTALREAMFGNSNDDQLDEETDDEEQADANYGLGKDYKNDSNNTTKEVTNNSEKPKIDEAKVENGEKEKPMNNENSRDLTEESPKSENGVEESQSESIGNSEANKENPKTPEPSKPLNGTTNGTQKETNGNTDHEEYKVLSRRPSYLRRESTITLPEIADSDDDDYEYSDTNKSVITKTIYVRTPSMEECS